MKKYIEHNKKCNGFTLLEVLVALLILAIGILGIAGLQFQALRFNHDAYLRTQISVTATDIMDLIRLNSANAAAYEGNHIVGAATGACDITVANDAANDLACWRQQLATVLPAGSQANIVSEVTPDGTQYKVTLVFTPREEGANPKTISFSFQPN
ncbi:MAG: type IV pilus modification protein PilV [Proteobacteria bacterium]|nr:type IV pilus modification protein PilV [Pseudomonadota bacterium]NOG61619.1 type IV pilus modification protein PilV [Pseudomonadota bacterium]